MINIEILFCFLIALFAIGSWIDLNGLWVELPLLVNQLPEGWQLPSYVILISQLSNIAPLVYMAVVYFGKSKKLERCVIYCILVVGFTGCTLLSIFWKHTVSLFLVGQWRSTSLAFLILTFIISMVDTTSSVTFLPYLTSYSSKYITALFVGEGLSGFLPAIVGLIQGTGGEPYCINKTSVVNGSNHTSSSLFYPPPLFSVSAFFGFLAVMLIISLVSFSIIDNTKKFHDYKTKNQVTADTNFSMDASEPDTEAVTSQTAILNYKKSRRKSKRKWIIYLLLVIYINLFTNGLLPSIQNYSLMPYSNTLYHTVIAICQILNPLACMLTFRKWKLNYVAISIMIFLGSVFSGYIIFLASKSPVAVLNSTALGQVLAAFSWFAITIIYSFLKTLLAIELQKRGHFWLQLCGISIQIGSALGAISMFICVVVYNLFQSKQIIC